MDRLWGSMSTSVLLEGLGASLEARAGKRVDAPIRRQWLDVDGFITDRLLVTYRAPAERLRALVPAPFVVDELNGFGFVSVCALEMLGMGIARSPRWLRFDNLEFLYRVGVRYRNAATFLTLRCDTASRALALLGGSFSHYQLRHTRIALSRSVNRFELRCDAADALARAELATELTPNAVEPASLFPSSARAAEFLLGMSFSAAVRGGKVLVQPIERDAWQPRFVSPDHLCFDYLAELARRIAAPLVYDNTLHVRSVHQTWRAARWQK